MRNIFTKEVTNEVIERIGKLTANTQPNWGKMFVGEMLAHCCVAYEMVYTDKHPKPNVFLKIILKLVVKKKVVSDKSYSKNGKTAPQFLIKNERNFEEEKTRLINYITKTQALGEKEFEGKESHSFGKLTADEWNNLFYKHLNHHLSQFGV